jgi:hypothetical protein
VERRRLLCCVLLACGRGRLGGYQSLGTVAAGGEYRFDPAGAVVELGVQVERRVDVCQVAERLREVAQSLAGQPDLLRLEAKVVGVSAHLLQR